MKLFIIVLCILSERYLVHAASYSRLKVFNFYINAVVHRIPQSGIFSNSYLLLALLVLPPVLLAWVLVCLLGYGWISILGFLLNLVIFYYCLGPQNPFYPVNTTSDDLSNELAAGNYFAEVNNQLFAVIFWFIIAGAPGIILYRLVELAKERDVFRSAALLLAGWMDWIPARITLLFYLLVGNFQQGFKYYSKMLLSMPENNNMLLSTGGLLAARTQDEQSVSLTNAQNLVEQALIICLVFLALFTLVAWM